MKKDPARKSLRAEAEAAFEEHRRISRLVCDLEQWLDEPADCARLWNDCLRERLEPLARILEPHFAGEEASPLYKEVPVDFPRFASSLDRLFEEHQRIISDLKSVLGEAGATTVPVRAQIRELTLRTKMIVFTLRRHESEENEILQQAYWDDLAAGD
ncbi:MAG: hemerythrin domain-containing protein [Candidatus Eisenbacteria bacterium]